MRDVAAFAGVDTSVVSRVLNGDERLLIRPETRQRVLDAVERLGYQPNASARMLKTSRAMAIGMVIPDLRNVAHAEIAKGAEQRANEHGYILLVASGRSERQLPTLEGRVDGLLYAVALSEPAPAARLPDGIPSLLVNRREPGLGPSIVGDDEAYAARATQHLIDLGHRRIAHIVAEPAVDTGRRRSAGYATTMNAAGIPVSAELTARTTMDEDGGYRATIELLGRSPRPTAVLIATTRWAIGALAACDELGVRVPEDLSIVTFTDVPITRYMRPQLSTIPLPLQAMGYRAVDLLLRIVDGERVDDVMLEGVPALVEGASTAPPPADAP